MGIQETTVVLIAAKTTTVLFGGILTTLSYKAFRRTGSAALGALAIGIGLLTVGALLGGVLHQVLAISLEGSVAVQALFTAIGFVVMTYSLYSGRADSQTRTDSGSQSGN